MAKLPVDLTDLAETMDFAVEGGTNVYLELRTGRLVFDEGLLDERTHLQLAPFPRAYKYQRMRQFATIAPPELADQFAIALDGAGAFRRFDNLVHHHGLRDAWDDFRLALDRARVEAWLEAEGVEVADVSTRVPPPPATSPAGPPTVALVDLLLLGAPGGDQARVTRTVPARSPAHSQALFARLAREAAAAAGLPPVEPTGGGDTLVRGRFQVVRGDDAVTVAIDVPAELRDRFR